LNIEIATRMHEIASLICDGENVAQRNITCPACSGGKLLFAFTFRRLPDQYGLYLVCPSCRMVAHFQLFSRPQNFSEDLVVDDFQALEDQAVRFADEFIVKLRHARWQAGGSEQEPKTSRTNHASIRGVTLHFHSRMLCVRAGGRLAAGPSGAISIASPSPARCRSRIACGLWYSSALLNPTG
jgi:hypothetical protein